MEERLGMGRPGSLLVIRTEGARAVFEAQMPDDKRGLYKAYITGAGGTLLLGTMIPEGSRLRLRRILTLSELIQKGGWPVTSGEVRLAFSFGGGSNTKSSALPGWRREENPARLMGDHILACAAEGLRGTLFRAEKDGFALALPFERSAAFPMPPLFCFAHVEPLYERLHVVFHFNSHGYPIFQNKEGERGHTGGVNYEKE